MAKIIWIALLCSVYLFGKNLPFELYKKGSDDGDTLLVIGGIHGDEPGGYFAPSILISHYTITKGNLWVVPNLNFESILRNSRGIYGDMNRKFHTVEKGDEDYEDIQNIKKIITDQEVDLVLNLHDGRGFYRHSWESSIFNPSAWGQAFIIDQKKIEPSKTKYHDLDELARKVSKNLNKELIENHHTFNIKNTKTKEKDEQMQLSLTYFAIKNNKPAFAVETSKNLTELVQKVKYQLKAIESFMEIMGIEFQRNFELNDLEALSKIVYNFQKVTINDVITIDLEDIRPALYYFPLRKGENTFKFDHPLGAVIEYEKRIDVMIGNQRVGSLYPQYFEYGKELKKHPVSLMIDGVVQQASLGDIIKAKNSFQVQAPQEYRINIIGFSKDGVENENNIKIEKKDILSRFSIDKSESTFRVEFYRNGFFSGTILIDFE